VRPPEQVIRVVSRLICVPMVSVPTQIYYLLIWPKLTFSSSLSTAERSNSWLVLAA
jgi:hypothetical protein